MMSSCHHVMCCSKLGVIHEINMLYKFASDWINNKKKFNCKSAEFATMLTKTQFVSFRNVNCLNIL